MTADLFVAGQTIRFRKSRPCPICGGGDDMPRGQGRRCSGYLSSDGRFAYCTREEHAGQAALEQTDPPSYRHILEGDCRCGAVHAPAHPVEEIVYDYTDESDKLLFQVVRRPGKKFLQRRPGPDGAWIWNVDGVRSVVYRLHNIAEALVFGGQTVYIVEGEKDVLAIEAAKNYATCNPGGAGKWKTEHTVQVLGAGGIVIVADRDDPKKKGEDGFTPGERHALKIRAGLVEHGYGGDVSIVQAAEGKDVSDHLAAGLTLDELVPIELEVKAEPTKSYEFVPLAGFLKHSFPRAEPLLGAVVAIYLAIGSLLLVYGAEGTGKSTWTIDAVAHLAAGLEWLGIPVPRPVRICVIENEGPPGLFQQKLADKAASWDGPTDWIDNVFLFQSPWGGFSFAEPAARQALTAFCDEHKIDLVVANPTLGLGVEGSGKPADTNLFVEWLVECGLKSTRAFWLLHHENKAGQISGDWGRHPDTKVQLQADGNQPRTKLIWEKTRWATLPTETQPKACLLDWVTDTKSYTVVPLESAGASDNELEARISDYLREHPMTSTTAITKDVTGTNSRIRALLEGDSFDCVDGSRGAKLWFIRESL